MGLKGLFKKSGDVPANEQPASPDTTAVPSGTASIQEKAAPDGLELDVKDIEPVGQGEGEKGDGEKSNGDIVYLTGLPLVIIIAGLCLAVLLVALVSSFRRAFIS